MHWLQAMRRYLVASAAFHCSWEVVQLPLYTIWSESAARQAFAVLHCTLGDVMIAALALILSLAVAAGREWPNASMRATWIVLLVLGDAYTAYSEWLNVSVRGNWAYAPSMPTLPWIGTGLAPLLQWLVVPTLALRAAVGYWPWQPRKAGT
jgi:hypothetical protein